LVRKALKVAADEETIFKRPLGAEKGVVAIRLAGQGRLSPLTLTIDAAAPEAQSDPFFTAAVRMLAQRREDKLLTEYLDRALLLQGPVGRRRYLGAAANEAARAGRFQIEAQCLLRLYEAAPSRRLEQKIALSRYRS